MKLSSAIAIVTCAALCSSHDVSGLPDGTYKVLVSANGTVDWDTVSNSDGASFKAFHLPALMKYPLSRVRRTASSRDHENNHTDEDDDDDENIAGIGERPPSHIAPGAHCHHHFPIHKTSFLPGLLKINKNSEPQCLAYFMDWISQGIESGWIHKRELRFSKFEDLIIGACIFKHHKKRLCVHEIATSMRAANSECAGGRIGCHVCVGNWGKDYFRFDAREAPNQCECAWYY